MLVQTHTQNGVRLVLSEVIARGVDQSKIRLSFVQGKTQPAVSGQLLWGRKRVIFSHLLVKRQRCNAELGRITR